MLRWLPAILAWTLFLGAAPGWSSPLWSSDDIRAKRSTGDVEALIFDLRQERTQGGKTLTTQSVVTLAPDFTDIADAIGGHDLDDHALCLTLSWKPVAAVVESTSCYASVGFRVYELRNRKLLGSVLDLAAKADSSNKPKAAVMRLYGAEAELGVADAGVTSLSLRRTQDGPEFRLDGVLVASLKGKAADLSADEARRLVRFIARRANVHPIVRDEMAKAASLPSEIFSDFAWNAEMGGRQTLRISNVRRQRVSYPLPRGLASALAKSSREGASPKDLAVRAAMTAIESGTRAPALEETLSRAERAMAGGRGLEALFLTMQAGQDHPEAFTPSAAAKNLSAIRRLGGVMQAALKQTDAAQFMDANRLAGSRQEIGDREAAARFLASDRFAGLPFETFRNVTFANLLGMSDTKGWAQSTLRAMPDRRDNYWVHLAAHPWAGNAWKDAGDVYFNEFDPVIAWQAYDIGRQIDRNWRDGVLSVAARFEAQLRTNEPDFF